MSIILQASARFIAQIMLLLSVLLVLRGHNNPGGGFIGALFATNAFALYTLAFGLKSKQIEKKAPIIASFGVILLVFSFLGPTLLTLPPLSGVWIRFELFHDSILMGSPLVFDFGIYCIVAGSLVWLMAILEK